MPPVRAALARGALAAVPVFARLTADGVAWHNGRDAPADAVIFATGLRPVLAHLEPLGVVRARARVAIAAGGSRTRAAGALPRWLVGDGDWTRRACSPPDLAMASLAVACSIARALRPGLLREPPE